MKTRYKEQLNMIEHEIHKLLPESDITFRWDEKGGMFYVNVATFYKGESIEVTDCISNDKLLFPEITKGWAVYLANSLFEMTRNEIYFQISHNASQKNI